MFTPMPIARRDAFVIPSALKTKLSSVSTPNKQ